MGVKILDGPYPPNRLRMIPKRLSYSDFDAQQKLPRSVIPKVGGGKKSMVQKSIYLIENDPKTRK